MKFFKKGFFFGDKTLNEDQTILSKLKSRVSHLRRKLSRGAADIFRIIKSRNHWGNKKLWGHQEKGRNKAGHKPPKH